MIKNGKIALNGVQGSNSDLVRRILMPDSLTLPFLTFEDAFSSLETGEADLALIPVDNSLAGRVADVHRLLADYPFHIVAEHFQPIDFALMAIKGAQLSDIKDVYSHVHALPQCRHIIKELNLTPHIHADTAGAAKDVAVWGDKTKAALAPPLAAEIYNLDILRDRVQDNANNMTRFIVLSRDKAILKNDDSIPYLTSLHFEVRNIPAALYKALGGFATNAVQIIKLESYVDEKFTTAKFYAEIIGQPSSRTVDLALDELAFFAKDIRLMGTYPAHTFRNLNLNSNA